MSRFLCRYTRYFILEFKKDKTSHRTAARARYSCGTATQHAAEFLVFVLVGIWMRTMMGMSWWCGRLFSFQLVVFIYFHSLEKKDHTGRQAIDPILRYTIVHDWRYRWVKNTESTRRQKIEKWLWEFFITSFKGLTVQNLTIDLLQGKPFIYFKKGVQKRFGNSLISVFSPTFTNPQWILSWNLSKIR